jgi:catechol 2,3-dioxygenase-like lactoylglutathione lyase family enzyme
MITGVSKVVVPVDDQERAKQFWTERVGFTLRRDESYGAERWIEVSPPDGGPLLVLSPRAAHERKRELPDELPHSPAALGQLAMGRLDVGAVEEHAALERLDALIGRWRTQGRTTAASRVPPDQIDAVDTYERPPGGALLHLVEARVGDQKVEGAEIIGFDPARGRYVTHYFGSDGPNAYEASLVEQDGALVWTMRSTKDRFTGTFNDERNVITGHWDALDDDSTWQPWMDITLTREAS